MSELYERIKELAENGGMSVNQLRIKAGLSASVLNELKQGRTKDLSRKTVQKLADVLGLTVEDFYPREANKEEITKEQLKFALFNGDKGITDEMVNEVLAFAKFVEQRENNK